MVPFFVAGTSSFISGGKGPVYGKRVNSKTRKRKQNTAMFSQSIIIWLILGSMYWWVSKLFVTPVIHIGKFLVC